MFLEERHQKILDLLEETGSITTSMIQRHFNVGYGTARADLEILEKKGLLKRTHGGAIPISKIGQCTPVKMSFKDLEITENYQGIAIKACSYIEKDEIIYITSGTTGYVMSKYLPQDIKFTVVTNSISIADEIKFMDNVDIYLCGGKMRPKGTVVDSFATEFVRNMRFDKCFMTCAGISVDFGMSNGTHETVVFQRTVIENSKKNILLAPNHKINYNGFLKVVDADAFDMIITDNEAVEEELDKFRELGIEIVIA